MKKLILYASLVAAILVIVGIAMDQPALYKPAAVATAGC